MRIAILADLIDNHVIKGEATYAFNLINGLHIKGIDLTLLYADLPARSNFNGVKKESYRIWKLPFVNKIIKDKLANNKAGEYDILHETTNYGMPAGKSKATKIITLHDVGPLVFSQYYHPYTLDKFKYEIPEVLKKTDAIITVSNFQKKEIRKYYRFPDEKIHVIYQGIDQNIYQKTNKPRLISEDYILHSGGLNPRKGLIYLIEALHILKDKIPHKIYAIGDPDRENKTIRNRIEKYELEDRIIVKKIDSFEELANLYSYASVFIYPSLYEGFGVPPLEAMACGCPVITSDNSSLRELYRNKALIVYPTNVNDMGEKIYRVLTNGVLLNDLINGGYKLIKRFKWEYNIEKTINLYNMLLGRI